MTAERRLRAVGSVIAANMGRTVTARQAARTFGAAMLALLAACGNADGSASQHAGGSASQHAAGTSAAAANAESAARGNTAPGNTASAQRGTDTVTPKDTLQVAMTYVQRPDTLRGLYVNRWAAIGNKMWELIGVARRTEVNALVIDVKDDRGFVLYRSGVPLAIAIGADTNRPMSSRRMTAVLDSMRASNIYPIARIVVAKDPLLARARLQWAIKRRTDGNPWLDAKGNPWLDPTQPAVWQYAIDLAREAHRIGFSAVQFDYVRFPDDDRMVREATFPLAHGRTRAEVIRDQLGIVRDSLHANSIPMTIDVFGLTATDTTDMGIGQRWEMFVDRADVVLPMVYPSHFAPGTYGLANPNANPYTTIDRALKDVKRRSAGVKGAATIVPWYQDFTLGPPHYGASQVRGQIKAGYDNGFFSWILWNPGSRYTTSALLPDATSD